LIHSPHGATKNEKRGTPGVSLYDVNGENGSTLNAFSFLKAINLTLTRHIRPSSYNKADIK